jgi:hypothetical protein
VLVATRLKACSFNAALTVTYCDVILSIARDLPRFTVIDRGDAVAAKWLTSQR